MGRVNVNDDDFRRELDEWITTGRIPAAWIEHDRKAALRELTQAEAEADARFQLALVLLNGGNKEGAVAELRKAFRLDPQNWLIRKQMWAIEHPEAFYDGNVDYAWQKKQIEKENAELQRGQ